MKTGLAVVVSVLVAACSSGPRSGPTGPSSTGGAPASPVTWTLSGELRPTTGDGVGGAVSFAGQQAVSDSGGRFTFTHAQAVPQPLTVARHDWLERQVWLAGGQTRADLVVRPIVLTPPFDLAFYRQFARDSLSGLPMIPLSHWAASPSFYVVDVDDRGGVVDAATISSVIGAIVNTVQSLTPFGVPVVERGASPPSSGRVVVWLLNDLPDFCGVATVGPPDGRVRLRLGCRCAGDPGQISPALVQHEIGHVLGFWHVSSRDHVMWSGNVCGGSRHLSEKERFHAHLVYSRPRGNRDPDHDPASHLSALAPVAASRREVSCLAP